MVELSLQPVWISWTVFLLAFGIPYTIKISWILERSCRSVRARNIRIWDFLMQCLRLFHTVSLNFSADNTIAWKLTFRNRKGKFTMWFMGEARWPGLKRPLGADETNLSESALLIIRRIHFTFNALYILTNPEVLRKRGFKKKISRVKWQKMLKINIKILTN